MKLYSQKVSEDKPTVANETEMSVDTPKEKVKKPRTEKQIAALAKAQEARKRKKEAEISVQKVEEPKEEPKGEPKEVPKEEPKEVEPEPAKEKIINDEDPPKWFVKYVKEKNKRRNEKEGKRLSIRAEKRESQEIATSKWAEPKIREKIEKTVESHEDRMYRLMFGRRR